MIYYFLSKVSKDTLRVIKLLSAVRRLYGFYQYLISIILTQLLTLIQLNSNHHHLAFLPFQANSQRSILLEQLHLGNNMVEISPWSYLD